MPPNRDHFSRFNLDAGLGLTASATRLGSASSPSCTTASVTASFYCTPTVSVGDCLSAMGEALTECRALSFPGSNEMPLARSQSDEGRTLPPKRYAVCNQKLAARLG